MSVATMRAKNSVPKRSKKQKPEDSKEFQRGKKDALGGHIPESEDGPYFKGYTEGYRLFLLDLLGKGSKYKKECM